MPTNMNRNCRPKFALSILAFSVAFCSQHLSAATLEERVSQLEATQRENSKALANIQNIIDRFDVSGFISVRGARINRDDSTYLAVLDDNWSFSDESVVGLQLNGRLTDKFSVSMQLRTDVSDNRVDMEWAYFEYAIASDLTVRAGRLRPPGALYSESLDVAYAYPWVQIPQEVYSSQPYTRYEGVDLRYWVTLGDVDIRLNPFYGTASDQLMRDTGIDFGSRSSEMYGLDMQFNYDIFTLQLSATRNLFTSEDSVMERALNYVATGQIIVPEIPGYVDEVKIPGFVDYISRLMVDGALGTAIDNIEAIPGYDSNPFLLAQIAMLSTEQDSLTAQIPGYYDMSLLNGKSRADIFNIGLTIDNGKFMSITEIGQGNYQGSYPDFVAGYVMVGYRFGNWMPHFTFGKVYTQNDDQVRVVPDLVLNDAIWSSDPSLAAVAAYALNINDLMKKVVDVVRLEQETYTLGLRWDPIPGVAVKGEIFRAVPQDKSHGFVIPTSLTEISSTSDVSSAIVGLPEFPDGGVSINGVRLSLDLVF